MAKHPPPIGPDRPNSIILRLLIATTTKSTTYARTKIEKNALSHVVVNGYGEVLKG